MRITHVVGYFQPEVGYEEYYSARTQVDLGHEVTVITSDRVHNYPGIVDQLRKAGSQQQDRRREAGIEEVDGITVHRLPAAVERNGFVLVKGMAEALRQHRPEVVHAHDAVQGATVQPLLHRELGFGYLLDIHEYAFPGHALTLEMHSFKDLLARWEYTKFLRRVITFAYAKADRIVAVSDVCRDFVLDYYKLPPSRVLLSHLGVYTQLFRFSKEGRAQVREELGIGAEDMVLVTSGLVSRRKRFELILDRIPELEQAAGVPVRLMLLGDGDPQYMAELRRLAKVAGPNRVVFAGFQRKEVMARYYSAADIAVWTNNNSIVALEAMACGLPIVIPKLALHMFASHDNGIVFPLGDMDAMVEAIRELLADKERRHAMGKSSRKAVEEKYAYHVLVPKIVRIYEEIAGGHAR